MEGSGNWIMDGAVGTFFHTEGAVLGGVEAGLEVSSWRARWLERASRSNWQWD